MTFQPGDIIRRVRGDSPSWRCGSLHEVSERDVTGKSVLPSLDCYELVYRPVIHVQAELAHRINNLKSMNPPMDSHASGVLVGLMEALELVTNGVEHE